MSMSRLPEGWATPEVVGDQIEVDGVLVHRAGVSAIAPTGEEICGSAADSGGAVERRAWFELAERICALEAIRARRGSYPILDDHGDVQGKIARADAFPESTEPDRWVYARSNGVALHSGWRAACAHAAWELAERDRVLRSWLGEILPRPIPHHITSARYDWKAYTFPAEPGSFSENIHVVGMFGLPLEDGLPVAMGFAGRPVLADALDDAAREATQQLAFLWGEPVPVSVEGLAPGAALHLDTFQLAAHRSKLRRWLAGDHVEFAPKRPDRTSPSAPIRFIDLTAGWLADGADDLRVAKALCDDALVLAFGDAPLTRHLPAELRIHPIP